MQQQQGFHPVTDFKAGIFNTGTGKLIKITDPKTTDIDIRDISQALSKICRFGGHANTFYSVAQHSILVSRLVPEELRREGLMHDASEAYLGDVIKPLKEIVGGTYKQLEEKYEALIAELFGLDMSADAKEAIKIADNEALKMEHAAFIMDMRGALSEAMERHKLFIDGGLAWEWRTAQYQFFTTFITVFDDWL